MEPTTGWRIFTIRLPDGTEFMLSYRGDTLRIRNGKDYWVPVEVKTKVEPDENTETKIQIYPDIQPEFKRLADRKWGKGKWKISLM